MIEQSPGGGQKADAGSTVRLTVGKLEATGGLPDN